MTLAIPQVMLGAQVAITHDEKGKRLPVERRGYIYAIDVVLRSEKLNGRTVVTEVERNGNPARGVQTIWVKLKKGEEPVAVKNCQLTLVQSASRKAYDEIMRDMNVKKANEIEEKNRETDRLETIPESDENIPIVIPDDPVVVNEITPDAEGRALTADEIRALEAGDEIPPEPLRVAKRVFPEDRKKT